MFFVRRIFLFFYCAPGIWDRQETRTGTLYRQRFESMNWLQEEQNEHGQGKWEGKQKGKSDKRITISKARQKESTTLCTNLAD
jgi:hypothetical protein